MFRTSIIIISFLVLPCYGNAFYEAESFWDSSQGQPAWFEADNQGGFFGETVEGFSFTQRPVINDSNVRLHKFAIGNVFFYISDHGVIKATDDLSAISIYFTLDLG